MNGPDLLAASKVAAGGACGGSLTEGLIYGRPPESFLSPVNRAGEALGEVWRAQAAGALATTDALRIAELLDAAGERAAEVLDLEYLHGPTSPRPKEFHRPDCDCPGCLA